VYRGGSQCGRKTADRRKPLIAAEPHRQCIVPDKPKADRSKRRPQKAARDALQDFCRKDERESWIERQYQRRKRHHRHAQRSNKPFCRGAVEVERRRGVVNSGEPPKPP
jgi:hypothetical protein